MDRFDSETQRWLRANGAVTWIDLSAAIGELQRLGRTPIVWVELAPQWPNCNASFTDTAVVISGFQVVFYFESMPGFPSLAACPLGGPL